MTRFERFVSETSNLALNSLIHCKPVKSQLSYTIRLPNNVTLSPVDSARVTLDTNLFYTQNISPVWKSLFVNISMTMTMTYAASP